MPRPGVRLRLQCTVCPLKQSHDMYKQDCLFISEKVLSMTSLVHGAEAETRLHGVVQAVGWALGRARRTWDPLAPYPAPYTHIVPFLDANMDQLQGAQRAARAAGVPQARISSALSQYINLDSTTGSRPAYATLLAVAVALSSQQALCPLLPWLLHQRVSLEKGECETMCAPRSPLMVAVRARPIVQAAVQLLLSAGALPWVPVTSLAPWHRFGQAAGVALDFPVLLKHQWWRWHSALARARRQWVAVVVGSSSLS